MKLTHIPSDLFIPLCERSDELSNVAKSGEIHSGNVLNFFFALIVSFSYLVYAFFELIVKISWEIPYLNVWALWTVGGLVEVWYTGRPTVFSNVIALILFSKEVEIEIHLIKSLLFCYIGFGIFFAIIAMIQGQTRRTHPSLK